MRSARRLTSLIAALASVTTLAAAGPPGSRAALLPTLYVNYTTGCTFTITNDAGAPVTSIAPGTYQLLIITPGPFGAADLSGSTDFTSCKGFVQFQLSGPGENLSTTLEYGDLDHEMEQVTLAPSSSYLAQDLNQPAVARWTLTTTSSGSPTVPPNQVTTTAPGTAATTVPKPSAPARPARVLGTVAASVSAAGTIALSYRGQALSSLSAGRYTIAVSDRSTRGGLILRHVHEAAVTITTGAFVGRRSVTLTLAPGEWFFSATPAGKEGNFIAVA